MTHRAYLLTGGNIGDRRLTLQTALKLIHEKLGKVLASSRIFETAPWGFDHDTPFLNQAVLIETLLSPHDLLAGILEMEQGMGRVREGEQWKERLIDIDILFYDNLVMIDKHLHIPHPHLHKRRFALVPMADINESMVHPVLSKSIRQLLTECPDMLEVKPLE
jgi:2-amino-4-hydroxy-6-hydroxymethyldihydropteridine diphosphokinase